MASVNVFGSPTSSEVAMVLACLFEKDVAFQLVRVDNYKGLERKPDYLKMQPARQSLTFQDGKVTLVDPRSICRYVAQTYPDQGNQDLIGRGTSEWPSIEQWLSTEAHSFDRPSSTLVFHLALPPAMRWDYDNAAVNKSKMELNNVLDIYEQRLDKMRYLAGDKFTLADLSHLPDAHRLITNCPGYLEMFQSRKNVNKWWIDISNRASWKKVVGMQQDLPTAA